MSNAQHDHAGHAHPHGGHAHADHGHGHDDKGHDDKGRGHGHGHGHEHGHGHGHRGGIVGFVKELIVPHSHDSADKVDSALEASREGMRCLKVSFAGLLITALVQTVIV